MVGITNPVVYGGARRYLWPLLGGLYVLTQSAGGVCVGLCLGALGMGAHWFFGRGGHGEAGAAQVIPVSLMVTFLGAGCVAAALREFGLVRLPLPNTAWQVPPTWRRFGPLGATALYGFVIGLGVATKIPHTTLYVVLLMCLALANPWLAGGLMGIYGAMRAATSVWIAAGEAKVPDRTQRTRCILFFGPFVSYLNAMALAFVGGLLTVLGLRASLL